MLPTLAVVGLTVLSRAHRVAAQVAGGVSNATCLPNGFEWVRRISVTRTARPISDLFILLQAYNHLGQSPCELAAFAGGICLTGSGKGAYICLAQQR